ncbi:uncharacterized protein LOC110902075 [Helianthus annuus]|uniref:uncharacterized protein LOC110902075 n=1 Tax=Helianthus annuus TaxID=4232 RepID=UPI000B902687|nr:uncharacterized protein LOC110902075 [Helianthus annuus]
MSESKGQEDMDKEAFEQWKLRWQKNYTTPREEMFRFERFQENLRLEEANSGNSGPSQPPWMALDSDAAALRELEEYLLLVCNHSGDVSSDSDTDSEGRELRASGYHKVFLREQNEDGTFRMDTFYSKNPTHPISDVGARYYKGQSGRKKDDIKEEEKRQKSGCGGCCSGSGTGT